MVIGMFGMVTTVCFLAFLAPDSALGSPQKITFYNQVNCPVAGRHYITYVTDRNLRNSDFANATSIRVVGVWKIYIENVNNGQKHELGFRFANPPHGMCVNKLVWPVSNPRNFTIYAAERFGPSDMTTSQLILFTGTNLTGRQYTINNYDLPSIGSVRFRSYAHFSNTTWTLFGQPNYRGNTTLLRPSAANARDNFVFNKNTNIVVGSVRSWK